MDRGALTALREWYAANGRHTLPWRLTRDPYAVLVSEVMLQQTQVERVIPSWEGWLGRWPDVRALAAASPADVLRAWAGLGYNRRGLHLHRMAQAVAPLGQVPVDVDALRALPGVGPYTARAVASFAGGVPVAVVETNVGRVLARTVHGVALRADVRPAVLQATADALLPEDGMAARDHNLALMDLGAMVCTSRAPACLRCPLTAGCAWRAAGAPPSAAAKAPAGRFEDTRRFARGRIVDALRGRDVLSEAQLKALLPAAHAVRLEEYLAGLEADGLVERVAGGWALPGG
jgi:A/G-specific adenine glycosylase